MIKIATWNVNSLRVRLAQVLEWAESAGPDILALQETKLTDANFPVADIEAAGYSVCYAGQPTYNGVAILSRATAEDVVTDLPGLDDPQRRVLAATVGQIRLINLYVPNGQSVGSEKYQYKLAWLERLKAFIATELDAHEHVAVVGDFNIAPEDRDVHDPKAWAGQVLCSEPEREAFADLLGTGLTDAFRLFEQPEASFSWWDYRQAAFRRNLGLRIDHILVSAALAGACEGCWIDREPRTWERPSDHAPVMASFKL